MDENCSNVFQEKTLVANESKQNLEKENSVCHVGSYDMAKD